MTLSAQVIAELVTAGLSGDALVEACRRIEASQASLNDARVTPGAMRQRRYREKLQASQSVTSDVTNVTVTEDPVVVDNTTILESTDKPTSSSTPLSRHQQRVTRGTRMSPDFTPKPAALEQWRREGGGTDEEYWGELQKTKDYWIQRPGSKALSLDWDRVWLNRVKDVCGWKKERLNGRTQTTGRVASISERFARFREEIDASGPSEEGHDSGGEDTSLLPGLRQSA